MATIHQTIREFKQSVRAAVARGELTPNRVQLESHQIIVLPEGETHLSQARDGRQIDSRLDWVLSDGSHRAVQLERPVMLPSTDVRQDFFKGRLTLRSREDFFTVWYLWRDSVWYPLCVRLKDHQNVSDAELAQRLCATISEYVPTGVTPRFADFGLGPQYV